MCLGEHSGNILAYGGKGSFRAGGRLSQYNKTEALVTNPDAFIVALSKEIDVLKASAEREDKTPAIRLNVLSDFPPKFFKPIMERHPEVEFYDYTKLGTKPSEVKNHSLTYSSQGVSQIVNGEKIVNKNHNWQEMRKALDEGKNVAMAFTNKSKMPEFVLDKETNKKI